MALTELQVKALAPKEKRYMVRDDRGLYVEVQPNGNKHWRLRYYEGGKEKKLSLGEYPLISLKQAREQRDQIRVSGVEAKVPGSCTFEEVTREWLDRHIKGKKTDKYHDKIESIFTRYIFPMVGHLPIKEVTPPVLLSALRPMEARGILDTAHTALQVTGQIFRYAIAIGVAERNNAADLKGALAPIVQVHNASVTEPSQIAGLLRAMDTFSGSNIVKYALWFSAYTFGRPGEIRHAEWSEFDLERAEWRIPPEKMKMRRTHIVPLSRQVLAIIQELKPFTGHGRYVFPSSRSVAGSVPMSENTVAAALRRLGFTKEEMTAHGFRSMASTTLNEHGFNVDWIERQLAHVDGNSVRAAYNYAEHLKERRTMMQWYADHLDCLAGFNSSITHH